MRKNPNGRPRRTKKLRAEFRKEFGPNWFNNKKAKAKYDKLRFPWFHSVAVAPKKTRAKSRRRK
jgi:hypothetical protein